MQNQKPHNLNPFQNVRQIRSNGHIVKQFTPYQSKPNFTHIEQFTQKSITPIILKISSKTCQNNIIMKTLNTRLQKFRMLYECSIRLPVEEFNNYYRLEYTNRAKST